MRLAVTRSACLGLFAAGAGCSDEPGGPPLVARTHFLVDRMEGNGPSVLDSLYGQELAVEVVFPTIGSSRGSMSDTPECKSTTVDTFPAERTASGESAELVQTQILDMLGYWDLRLQLCTKGSSSVNLHSEIDVLNLAFACAGIPDGAFVTNADGYPQITSFTATKCTSTILDVVNNRILGNFDFELTFETGPASIP